MGMGCGVHHHTLVFLAVLAVCVAGAGATCRACPWQWVAHGAHCYRYFPEPLPADEVRSYCRRVAGVGVTDAGPSSADSSGDEMVMLAGLLSTMFAGGLPFPLPGYVWLNNPERTYEKHNMIFQNVLGAAATEPAGPAASVPPCSAQLPSVVANTRASGVSRVEAAPALVEANCALYVGFTAHLDLGDFAGTCVSDPDACVSETTTWSLWLKIDSSDPRNDIDTYLSTGGQTSQTRGLLFAYLNAAGAFVFSVRSTRKSWSGSYAYNVGGVIPDDAWFHLAVTVDLRPTPAEFGLFVDGRLEAPDSVSQTTVSQKDVCTSLYLGNFNKCGASAPDPVHAGSAAYSSLMVFDGLLTSQQIQNLHACGSLDWDLKVRSLYLDKTQASGADPRYVCKASASAGPTIDWRVYHADQAQWEDLGPSSGPGVDITATSLSTCVVQSVLVIDQSRGPSSDGDIVSCSATDGSHTASVHLHRGSQFNLAFSDHGDGGLLVSGDHWSYPSSESPNNSTQGRYPFICKKDPR